MALKYKVGHLIKTRYNSNIYRIVGIGSNMFGSDIEIHVKNINEKQDYVSSMFDLAVIKPEDIVPFTKAEQVLYGV